MESEEVSLEEVERRLSQKPEVMVLIEEDEVLPFIDGDVIV